MVGVRSNVRYERILIINLPFKLADKMVEWNIPVEGFIATMSNVAEENIGPAENLVMSQETS